MSRAEIEREATSDKKQPIRLDPGAHDAFMAYANLADYHLFRGHMDEAEELYRKARALAPDRWYVHLGLAAVLGLKGDLDEAKREIAETVKLNPEVRSIARHRAVTATMDFRNPQFQVLRQTAHYTGLRRAGFPEE